MLKSLNGGIYRNKTSRMVAVYNDKIETLHVYYGLDIRVQGPEEVCKLLEELRLEDDSLAQFKALLASRYTGVGNCTLDGNLMAWARNMGLNNREIAETWVNHFFPE